MTYRSVALVIIAFLAGVGTTWLVVTRTSEPDTHSGMDMPMETAANEQWTCSMHPHILEHEPGNCPICGMPLVLATPQPSAMAAMDGEVQIDPGTVQTMGVRIGEVHRRDIDITVRTVGTLVYDESRLFWVNTKYDGWIEKAYVRYVGENVTAGQRLFDIYSPELLTTQKEYLQALD